jgi:hypothetical protein
MEMVSSSMRQAKALSMKPLMFAHRVRGVVHVPGGVSLPKPGMLPPAAVFGDGLLELPEGVKSLRPDRAHEGEDHQSGDRYRREAPGRTPLGI